MVARAAQYAKHNDKTGIGRVMREDFFAEVTFDLRYEGQEGTT